MAATRQPPSTLLQLGAEVSAAVGDMQVVLVRELAARLHARGAPAAHVLPLQAAADQLEAAVRETRRNLETLCSHAL